MCLNPINIINRTKFLSTEYRQPYFMQVRCGKCVECQRQNSNEWHYRAFHHFKHELENGGRYCLFDTLTYASEYLPHLSDFMDLPDRSLDFPCFSFVDIRLFNVRLRRYLDKKGYGSNTYTYFLASEYGTHNTCRPHYHVLFFVDKKIPPLLFSRYVAKCWQKGRTDGIPYKSESYVKNHNLIDGSTQRVYRVTRYVSKYVMKSCAFQSELTKRINLVIEGVSRSKPEGWLESYDGRKYRNDLIRQVNQFHRQSRGFGASALSEITFGQDFLILPDLTKTVCRLPIPMYYKRKMYQKQIVVDGQRFWSWTERGMEYLRSRESVTIDLLEKRFKEIVMTYSIKNYPNLSDLAKYVVTERGMFTRSNNIGSLLDKLDSPLMFNYVTHNDELQFGKKFVTSQYCGVLNSYLSSPCVYISVKEMKHRCYFVDFYEDFLKKMADVMISHNIGVSNLERHRQRLLQLYKSMLV